MQGLGLYTLEELKFSPFGLLYTRGPSQYKIPAVCDVPLQFNVYLLPDSDNPYAIYSSKVGHNEEDCFQTPQSFSFLSYLVCCVADVRLLCRVLENPPSSWAVRCSSPSKTPWLLLAPILV